MPRSMQPIKAGGTNADNAQDALDNLTQVALATNEYVLTKDPGTGKALWMVGGVKKTGDSMTGPLTITVSGTVALEVNGEVEFNYSSGTAYFGSPNDISGPVDTDVVFISRKATDESVLGMVSYAQGKITTNSNTIFIHGVNGFAATTTDSVGNLTSVSGGGALRNRYTSTNYGTGQVSKASALSGRVVGQTGAGLIGEAAVYNAEAPLVASGASMTEYDGLRVEGGSVVGTLGSFVGVYIENLIAGTSRWGIYQAGATDKNYFNGNVGIGIDNPTSRLQVVGNADVVQLTVSNNATQTANSIDIKSSLGTVLCAIQGRGTYYTNIGTDNLIIGKGAGNTAMTGDGNTFLGDSAGDASTTARFTVAIGKDALGANTTTNQAVAIGYQALSSANGAEGIAIGYQAMKNFTIAGVGNVAIGALALLGGNTNYGFALGSESLKTGGQRSVGIGISSGEFLGNIYSDSVMIGYYAGNRQAGGENVFIGSESGRGSAGSSGAKNTAVGRNTGYAITSGASNIFIGYNAGYRQTTNSNLLIIDNQQRASTAVEATNAIIYGIMAATPAAQTLYLNSVVYLGGTTYLQADSRKIYFGAGDDMSVYYDGTSGYIKTSDVAPSDLHVTCGAAKTLVLDTTVWADIQFSISSGRVGVANFPDWDGTFTANNGEYKFDIGDYIDLSANELPHSWKEGTAVKPHLHLALDGANTSGGNQYVQFTVYIAYSDVNEVWTETSLTAEYTIPNGTADLTHLLLSMGDLAMTNNLIGTQMKIRLKRIAATGGTEYPNHIFVTQLGVHVENDTLGSRSVATK